MGCSPPWNFPGVNAGVGGHSLLQGIFLTQGSNLHLLHHRQSLALQADSLPIELREKPSSTEEEKNPKSFSVPKEDDLFCSKFMFIMFFHVKSSLYNIFYFRILIYILRHFPLKLAQTVSHHCLKR